MKLGAQASQCLIYWHSRRQAVLDLRISTCSQCIPGCVAFGIRVETCDYAVQEPGTVSVWEAKNFQFEGFQG